MKKYIIALEAIIIVCIVVIIVILNILTRKIPEGCVYQSVDGKIYNEGNSMPRKAQIGDIYTTKDYRYTCEGNYSEALYWNVKVIDTTKTEYEKILSRIAGTNVMSMKDTFFLCENMIEAPQIPRTVRWMEGTFRGCKALEKAPTIPKKVENMSYAFAACLSLQEAPKIPNGVVNMDYAFQKCIELEEMPDIPKNVKTLRYTFERCTNLKRATTIPENIEDMEGAFFECTSLTGNVEIDSNTDSYWLCFYGVDFDGQNITLSGKSSIIEKIKNN